MRAIWLNINDFSRELNQSNRTISINRNYSQFIIVHYQQNTRRSIDKYRWIECLYRRYWSEHSYFSSICTLRFIFNISYILISTTFRITFQSKFTGSYGRKTTHTECFSILASRCMMSAFSFLNGFSRYLFNVFCFFPHKISLRHFFARFWCDFYRNYLMTWLTP